MHRRDRVHSTACFQAIVDQARRGLVLARLRDPSTTLNELAFLAGFSETSSSYRAFRRWSGKTPAAYRATLEGSAA